MIMTHKPGATRVPWSLENRTACLTGGPQESKEAFTGGSLRRLVIKQNKKVYTGRAAAASSSRCFPSNSLIVIKHSCDR